MVLPSLPETVQRWERIQMSCSIRVSFAPDAGGRGKCWSSYLWLLQSVSVRVCCSLIQKVCTFFMTTHHAWANLFTLYPNRFGTKRVKANQVYQEYIQDKHHLHMNSTRWVTLTEFIKHLGRTGVARVDDTEKGWFIAWIDNSPKALAKAVRLIVVPSLRNEPLITFLQW